jgi:hypothetical protein
MGNGQGDITQCDGSEWLALGEAARRLGVSRAAIYGRVQLYRLRLVGHRFGAYAAKAVAESCSSLTAAGGLNPCRSISQVAL